MKNLKDWRWQSVLVSAFVVAVVLATEKGLAGGNIGNGALTAQAIPGCEDGTRSKEECLSYVHNELLSGLRLVDIYLDANKPEKARASLLMSIRASLRLFPKSFPEESEKKRRVPLTRQALKRTLELDRVFTIKCGENWVNGDANCTKEHEIAVNFLATYTRHIISSVIPLDLGFHFPLWAGYSICWTTQWWLDFAALYREAAAAGLHMYWGHNGGGFPNAFGLDQYEMRIAKQLFDSIVEDLNRDEFKRFFKNEILSAKVMAETLKSHIDGDQQFTNDKEAVISLRHLAFQLYFRLRQKNWHLLINENFVREIHQIYLPGNP